MANKDIYKVRRKI